jgi:ABC-2 type transport system permease protein
VLSDGRTAAITSLGLLIVMYFMETIGQSVEKLAPVRSLSLFHYTRFSDILVLHDMSFGNMAVLIVVAILFLALAVFVFRHRDINVT